MPSSLKTASSVSTFRKQTREVKYYYQGNTQFFFFLKAAPAAYGSPQARGQITAAGASLHRSHSAPQDPSRVCDLHHSSRQCWILNSLSETRDRTCVPVDTGWVLNPPNHTGTPKHY